MYEFERVTVGDCARRQRETQFVRTYLEGSSDLCPADDKVSFIWQHCFLYYSAASNKGLKVLTMLVGGLALLIVSNPGLDLFSSMAGPAAHDLPFTAEQTVGYAALEVSSKWTAV